MLKIQMMESVKATLISHSLREPSVFLTGPAEIETAIQGVIQKFPLNQEQNRALHIIADHSLGISRVGDQLLMGVFGEGGTGKSRMIDAIQGWFSLIHQGERLIITATTGAAAVKIDGSILHSAVSIPVEAGDPQGNKVLAAVRRKDKHILIWKHADYMIFDEASMMDAKVMVPAQPKAQHFTRLQHRARDETLRRYQMCFSSATSFKCPLYRISMFGGRN